MEAAVSKALSSATVLHKKKKKTLSYKHTALKCVLAYTLKHFSPYIFILFLAKLWFYSVQRQQKLAFQTKSARFFSIYLHLQCIVSPGSWTHCCLCLQEQHCAVAILTALDLYSASGVVLSQQILHHTCVIPRILHSRFVDLDSGVFPVGDNTCAAESGDWWQEGNSNKWKEWSRQQCRGNQSPSL